MLLVLSGPSGAGKDTVLLRLLRQSQAEDLQLSVSLTTRPKRPGETEGKDYFFTTESDFLKKIAADEILEYAQYNGHYYGTPKSAVDFWLAQGKTVLLNIEVCGAAKIRALYPDCVCVFLLPPSLRVLRERLLARQADAPDVLERRLLLAEAEIRRACEYEYLILNDALDDAVADLRAVIHAERLRVCRRAAAIPIVLGASS
jgi:guanylate kinase